MPNVKEIFDLLNGKVSKEDQDLIIKAYEYAKQAHEGQKRANGDPYFVHVFETGKNLAKLGMDAKTIAAGMLHDVLEDTEITEKEMEEEFGDEVVFLVKGVTKLGTLKYQGNIRHVESLRKFFMAMSKDLRVVIIKFADRLHNLETLEFLPEEKRKRIALESIDVYAPLANRLGMGHLKGEIEDAAFPYAYPKEYEEVEKILNERKEPYTKYLAEIKDDLSGELKKQKIKNFSIDYRVKHKYSLYKKLLRHDMDIEKVYDIVALRIIVTTIEECYRVLGIVHAIWRPLVGRIKDYIALPKPNGYKSIHTTVFTGSGGIAEIQIRTKEMHDEAELGVAAHFSYKESDGNKVVPDKTKFEWIDELKSLKDLGNKPNRFIENLKTDFFSNRIFVFTPDGDIIDLPEESSPIDFAYSIHSDIGNHISGIKINGKMVHFSEKLKNGDIVEIVTKKDANPTSKWLDYAKTSYAKKHIKSYLEKHSLLARLKSFGKS